MFLNNEQEESFAKTVRVMQRHYGIIIMYLLMMTFSVMFLLYLLSSFFLICSLKLSGI